jgi:RHS repeat-associated protein
MIALTPAPATDERRREHPKTHGGERRLQVPGLRFYSPALGRWVNRDPVEEAGSLNIFQYVANCPLILVDPDGMAALGQSPVISNGNGRAACVKWSYALGYYKKRLFLSVVSYHVMSSMLPPKVATHAVFIEPGKKRPSCKVPLRYIRVSAEPTCAFSGPQTDACYPFSTRPDGSERLRFEPFIGFSKVRAPRVSYMSTWSGLVPASYGTTL